MSKLLEELLEKRVSLASALERLIVICSKINNIDLSKWCSDEIAGYKKQSDAPSYRKFVGNHFTYSGLNGSFKVKDITLPITCFPNDIYEQIKHVSLCESINEIEKQMDAKLPLYIDCSYLASIANKKFGDGVSIIQIKQTIPMGFYSSVYSAVRLRVINALTSLENSGVNIDTADIKHTINRVNFNLENKPFYETIIKDGVSYTFKRKESKKELLFRILLDATITIATGIIVGLIVYFCTRN